jgi:hypothetical protein
MAVERAGLESTSLNQLLVTAVAKYVGEGEAHQRVRDLADWPLRAFFFWNETTPKPAAVAAATRKIAFNTPVPHASLPQFLDRARATALRTNVSIDG